MTDFVQRKLGDLCFQRDVAKAQRDEALAALKELSGAIEEQGALEVDAKGEPMSQSAAGRNWERRCVARKKALAVIAKSEVIAKAERNR